MLALKKLRTANGSLILRQLKPVDFLVKTAYNVHRLVQSFGHDARILGMAIESCLSMQRFESM